MQDDFHTSGANTGILRAHLIWMDLFKLGALPSRHIFCDQDRDLYRSGETPDWRNCVENMDHHLEDGYAGALIQFLNHKCKLVKSNSGVLFPVKKCSRFFHMEKNIDLSLWFWTTVHS